MKNISVILIFTFAMVYCSPLLQTSNVYAESFEEEIGRRMSYCSTGCCLTFGLIGLSIIKGKEEETQKTAEERIAKYLEEHPEISSEYKESMEEFKIEAGMTKDMVEVVLGKPNQISSTVVGSDPLALGETWHYSNHWKYGSYKVTFLEEKVVAYE